MRFYVKLNQDGKLIDHMAYPYLNAMMQEVTEQEYKTILDENGIDYKLDLPTPSQLREEAYNTQAIISWDGSMLTVTQAAQQWQYYAAEGDTAKTNTLTALIAAAKASIREQYPDEDEV